MTVLSKAKLNNRYISLLSNIIKFTTTVKIKIVNTVFKYLLNHFPGTRISAQFPGSESDHAVDLHC